MPTLTPEELEEYQAELEDLADRKKLNDELAKECGVEDKRIKDRIHSVATVLAGPNVRAVLPMPDIKLQWDRRIAKSQGGIDVHALETRLGTTQFRKLLCKKVVAVSWEVDADKYQTARATGELTDETLVACTVAPEVKSRSIYLTKMEVIADED